MILHLTHVILTLWAIDVPRACYWKFEAEYRQMPPLELSREAYEQTQGMIKYGIWIIWSFWE